MPESTVTLDAQTYASLQRELADLRQRLQVCEAGAAIATPHVAPASEFPVTVPPEPDTIRRCQRLADNGLGILYQFRVDPDGTARFSYISSSCRALLALEPAAIRQDANCLLRQIHPDDRDRFDAALADSAATLEPWCWDGRFLLADGRCKWLKIESRPERLSDGATIWDGWFLDITAYQQMAERLEAASDRTTAQLRAIADNTSAAIYVKDLQGRLIFANRRLEQFLQRPQAAILGRTEYELLPPELAEIFEKNDQAAIQRGEAMDIEEVVPLPDGLHTYLSSKFPLRDEAGEIYAIGSISTDITERQQAEAQLQETLALQTAILEGIDYSVVSVDTQGTIRSFNAGAERMLGYSATEVVGKANGGFDVEPTEIVQRTNELSAELGIDIQPGLETFVAKARRGQADEYEWTFIRKDGSRFPGLTTITALHDEQRELIGFVGITQDITERKQAEANQLKLSALVENSSDFIGIADLDGQIQYLNAAGRRLVGLSERAEIQSYTIDDFTPPERRAYVEQEILARLHSEGVWQGESSVQHFETGESLEVDVNIFLVREPETQAPICIACFVRDIQERKQAEANRLKLSALVENCNDFIGMVDLNGQSQYLNAAGRRLVGLSELSDIETHMMTDFIPPEYHARLSQEILPELHAVGSWRGELYLQHFETKEAIDVEFNLFLVREPETQEPICIAGFLRDIRERKRAQATQQKLAAIVENSSDFIGIADLEGNTEYANAAGLELVGLADLTALQGKQIADFHPAEFLPTFRDEALPTVLEQGIWRGEAYLKHFKTGEVLDVEQTLFVVTNPETQEPLCFATVIRDIREQKCAQEMQLRLAAVVENSSDFIGMSDLQGRADYINPAGRRLVGLPDSPADPDCSASDFLTAAETARFGREILPALLERGHWQGETCLQHFVTGEAIAVEQIAFLVTRPGTNDPLCLATMIRDIRERKQAEAALRQTTKNLKDAQRLARIGNWSLDLSDQTLHWSEEVFRISGRDPALGEPSLAELIAMHHPDEQEYVMQVTAAVTEVGDSNEFEARVQHPDKEWAHMHVKFEAVGEPGRPPSHLFGTTMDITERKQAAILLQQQKQELEGTLNELRAAQTRLIQSEKMSSLGQLVAGVAHEINNPVNFIYGNLVHTQEYTEGLLEVIDAYQAQYPEPVTELQELAEDIDLEFVIQDFPRLLDSMKLGAQRIREIVTSLRTFSRLDEADCKDANIHEGIDSTLLILQNRLKAKSDRPTIEVVKDYGPLSQVECYPGQLNQVFMNILANAIDAMEERDSQRTLAENKANPSGIWIATAQEQSGWLTIRIRDNGPGMNEPVRDRLFDPFFTTKATGKGTGLGMSISYQIVTERHGGTLTCTSEPGQGAEFAIAIPIRQALAVAS